MRSVRLIALGLASIALAACASTAPGWTFAPPPPATPVPSSDASGAPSAPTSPDAGTVQIVATGLAYVPADVSAPAGAAFTLDFVNNDASVPHDVVIKDGAGTEVFKTDVFPGVATKSYEVPALDAGSYPFTCTVHPTMTGTLTAG